MTTKNTTATVEQAELVVINYSDLDTTDIQQALREAFIDSSNGILAIRGVPGFVKAKRALLSTEQSYKLAHLPASSLQALEDPDTLYNAGWSHGKEKLGKSNEADWYKASFYYNPITDLPGTIQDREKYPLSYPANKWPLAEMPDFEDCAKNLGQILYKTTVMVAKQIDKLCVTEIASDARDSNGSNRTCKNEKNTTSIVSLYDALGGTDKVKARLLYYFPINNDTVADKLPQESRFDSWIGWHTDSGFLTALAGDVYFEESTGKVLDTIPDCDTAGLYIYNRQGNIQHVSIPFDCCAIQIGEATQIITGGIVAATPHCVKSSSVPGIARTSLACFVDTRPDFVLKSPSNKRDSVIDASIVNECVVSSPIEKRWTSNEQTFGEFLHATFSLYYSNDDKGATDESKQ